MKTQLTALLVPTDENSHFAISNNYLWFSKREYYIKSLSYQPQQLLILSDEKPEKGGQGFFVTGQEITIGKKIIASSPQLEGTLPISFKDMELFAEKWNNGEKEVKVNGEMKEYITYFRSNRRPGSKLSNAINSNGTINLIWEQPKEETKEVTEETIEEKYIRKIIEAIPDECILKYKPHLKVKSSELNEKIERFLNGVLPKI